jgi:hypothetical protein
LLLKGNILYVLAHLTLLEEPMLDFERRPLQDENIVAVLPKL